MTEEEKIQAESEELNRLIGNGMAFTVERVSYVRQKGFFSFLKKRIKKIQFERFEIHEPTLSVLDRIAAEQIKIELDDKLLFEKTWQNEVHKLTWNHSIRLARIIALAVIGEDYFISEKRGLYKYDDKRLNELTHLIAHGVKPSQLTKLVKMVNTISNMGDFMDSIRLMSASRTTMPILVEQEV